MPHPSPPPVDVTEIWTNLDDLLTFLSCVCANTPPGVWVASTDMLLTVEGTNGRLWQQCCSSGTVQQCCFSVVVSVAPFRGNNVSSYGVMVTNAC